MSSPYVVEKTGPFSFLAEAGKAAGAIGQQLEQSRQQKMQEARQAVTVLESMRDRGLLTPDYFSHPDVAKTYSAAGLPVPTTEPTLSETKTALYRRYAKGDQLTDQELDFIGARPKSAAIAEGNAQTVETQKASALAAGGAQGEAVSGIPSTQTAEAGRLAKLDPVFTEAARRYVAGAVVNAGGRIPDNAGGRATLLKDAYQRYTTESQSRGQAPQPPEVFKSYFDATLKDMIDKQRELDIASTRARETGAGSADRSPAYLNAINANIGQIRNQAKDLRTQMSDPLALFNYQKSRGLATLDQARVALDSEIRSLEAVADQMQQSFGNVLQAGAPSGAQVARKLAADQATRLGGQVQSGKIKIEWLDEWVAKGEITEGDRQAILDSMAKLPAGFQGKGPKK